MYWDPTYVLVIAAMLISAAVSMNVRRTYDKYSREASARGMRGRDAAYAILKSAGIEDVRIERVQGSLTDHYSPQDKVLRLSQDVYDSSSVAAIGVAAHECGHAIQHRDGYLPLKLRSISVPAANIGSRLSWPIILLGLVLGYGALARAGVFLFGFVVLFQLITLPVEFNASRRALSILEGEGILAPSELNGAGSVLRAAALTYVAALLSSLLQMARLLLITRGNRRRD